MRRHIARNADLSNLSCTDAIERTVENVVDSVTREYRRRYLTSLSGHDSRRFPAAEARSGGSPSAMYVTGDN